MTLMSETTRKMVDKFEPKTYYCWADRPEDAPMPRTVIVDTDEESIKEIYKVESPYRKDIQFLVPNMAWLRELYVRMELLGAVRLDAQTKLYKHVDLAERLSEEP